jgi:hypothetical protein
MLACRFELAPGRAPSGKLSGWSDFRGDFQLQVDRADEKMAYSTRPRLFTFPEHSPGGMLRPALLSFVAHILDLHEYGDPRHFIMALYADDSSGW